MEWSIAASIFYASVASMLVLPRRWLLVPWIATGLVDFSGRDFAAATDVGWMNVAKIFLPLMVLAIRLGASVRASKSTPTAANVVIAGLFGHAALSLTWSPFLLGGIKGFVYLVLFPTYVVLLKGIRRVGGINAHTVGLSIMVAVGIAAVQMYIDAGTFGSFARGATRFTAYVSPQTYAFTLVVLALFMISKAPVVVAGPTTMVIGAVLWANGSRTAVIWFLVGLLVAIVVPRKRHEAHIVRGDLLPARFIGGVNVAVVFVTVFIVIWPWVQVSFPHNRIVQALVALDDGNATLGLGTFWWRVGMYQTTISLLDPREWFFWFGHGLGSGAEVAIQFDRERYAEAIDPNRVLHNEYLRITYELGVVGLIEWLTLLTIIALGCLRCSKKPDARNGRFALAVAPGVIAALAVENVLASTSSAFGIALALWLVYAIFPEISGKRLAALRARQATGCYGRRTVHGPSRLSRRGSRGGLAWKGSGVVPSLILAAQSDPSERT